MKSDKLGEPLVGSPYSQERIIQALKGVNKLFWQEAKMDVVIDFIRSCEIRDEKLTTSIINCSECRSWFKYPTGMVGKLPGSQIYGGEYEGKGD